MGQTSIEELLKQCPSVYKLVVAAAKRAKELSEGAPKLINGEARKATSIALEEIRQGKVQCELPEDEAKSRGRGAKKRTARAGEKKKS